MHDHQDPKGADMTTTTPEPEPEPEGDGQLPPDRSYWLVDIGAGIGPDGWPDTRPVTVAPDPDAGTVTVEGLGERAVITRGQAWQLAIAFDAAGDQLWDAATG